MNVLEGMSMGLTPIVHDWFGAEAIFNGSTFRKFPEALGLIDKPKDPQQCREFVLTHHGLSNADKLVEIVKNG
jgi:hypothetical protein